MNDIVGKQLIIKSVCKDIVEQRTGKTWRNFFVNKIVESKGYNSDRPYYTCYVSYDNHPICDIINSEIINVTPAQIRNKSLKLILEDE